MAEGPNLDRLAEELRANLPPRAGSEATPSEAPPEWTEYTATDAGADAEMDALQTEASAADAAVRAATNAIRNMMQPLGQDPAGTLRDIGERPSDFVEHASPLFRALANAHIRERTTTRRVNEAHSAREAQRQRTARAEARRGDEERLYARFMKENDEWVQLNVGGEVTFTTSLATLRAADEGSPLEVLFSGRVGDVPGRGGVAFFIDRDPLGFRYLLACLRELRACKERGSTLEQVDFVPEKMREAALAEARYFEVESLVELLSSGGGSFADFKGDSAIVSQVQKNTTRFEKLIRRLQDATIHKRDNLRHEFDKENGVYDLYLMEKDGQRFRGGNFIDTELRHSNLTFNDIL